MSEFNDRVRDSQVVANLKEANAKLDQLSNRDWKHQSRIDLIHRLQSVGKSILARLNVNRGLVAEDTLSNLAGPSSNFLHYVNYIAATSDDDNSYSIDATRAADSLLVVAATLPALHIRTTKDVFDRAFEQFDREVKSSMGALSERFGQVDSEVAGVGNRIEETSTQFINHVADLERKLSDGLSRSENESATLLGSTRQSTDSLLTQIRRANERLEREITSIQEVFRESQKDRDRDFENSQVSRAKTYHDWLDPTVSDVEKLRNQARSMLEEVAGAGTAAHYSQQRNQQNTTANRWRIGGVVSLLGLVLAAGWIFVDAGSTDADFSVVWLVARSGLVAAILILATYALRQSAHHRRREEDMTRVANELQLLWPFMNRLPEEDRQALLREITPLYFTGALSGQQERSEPGEGERSRGGILDRIRRPSSD